MVETWQGGVSVLDLELLRVAVGGRQVGYRRTGSGQPVVLLHGGLSDGTEWLPVMARLADVADLVAMDVPGCGHSEDPPEMSSLADLADMVAAFVGRLGLDRPHLGGLSFGGGLALQVATRHPDLPASLVIMSGYAGWAGSLPPEEVAARLAWARAVVDEPLPAEPVGLVPGLLGSRLPPELVDLLAQATAGVRPGPTKVLLEAFAAADLRSELSAVRCPTVVVHGELDERAPRPVAEALHRGIAGSRLVVVPGVGHQVNLEAPDRVADLLRGVVIGAGPRQR
jgi:pimeloyl-ACP methyl ester carboxylesterase